MKIRKIIDNKWYLKRNECRQGKLRLYTNLKKRPSFEQYLKLSNPKLWQAIANSRIRVHRLPIETGCFKINHLQKGSTNCAMIALGMKVTTLLNVRISKKAP